MPESTAGEAAKPSDSAALEADGVGAAMEAMGAKKAAKAKAEGFAATPVAKADDAGGKKTDKVEDPGKSSEAKPGDKKPPAWKEVLRAEQKSREKVAAELAAAKKTTEDANRMAAEAKAALEEVGPLLAALKSGDLKAFLSAGKFSTEQLVDIIADEKKEPTAAEIAAAETRRLLDERDQKAAEERKAADEKQAKEKKEADERAWEESQKKYRATLSSLAKADAKEFVALNALAEHAPEDFEAAIAGVVEFTLEVFNSKGEELAPVDALKRAENAIRTKILKLAGLPWVGEATRPKSDGKSDGKGGAGAQPTITTRNTTGVGGAAVSNDDDDDDASVDMGAVEAAMKRAGYQKYLNA